MIKPRLVNSLLLLCILALSACAHRPAHDPADPLESINRKVFAFNMTADKYVLEPVARGYRAALPGFVRGGVRNVFANLAYPLTIVSQFLQGKPVDGVADLGRFLINSTLGIGGLVDVASHWGLPAHKEDLGQTFGTWGIGEGWYLMLPFLGATTNRDLLGRILGTPANLATYPEDAEVLIGVTALDTIQVRADFLEAGELLKQQLDPYAFARATYLQKRWNDIHDGAPPAEAADDEFEVFDDF